MDSRSPRIASTWPLLAGWLAFLLTWAGTGAPARAQTSSRDSGPGPGGPSARTGGSRPDAGRPDRAASGAKTGKGSDKAGAGAGDQKKAAPAAADRAPGREPSPEFQAEIRKTVEKRRQRRARRAPAMGGVDGRPPGAIVPWPMPPALIIRQTPEVHDEIHSLLGQLRRGG